MFLNTTLEDATCFGCEHQALIKIVFPGMCAGGGIHEVNVGEYDVLFERAIRTPLIPLCRRPCYLSNPMRFLRNDVQVISFFEINFMIISSH